MNMIIRNTFPHIHWSFLIATAFTVSVQLHSIDGFSAPTAVLDLKGRRIERISTPRNTIRTHATTPSFEHEHHNHDLNSHNTNVKKCFANSKYNDEYHDNDDDIITNDSAEPMSRRDYFLYGRNALLTSSLLTLLPSDSTADETQSVTTTPPSISSSSITPLSSSITTTTTSVDIQSILKKASKKAIGGGKAGASASIVQVCTLMWLRTAMNYQYRYGGTLTSSLSTLYSEGGIRRLYRGFPFALIQGPLTRFGDTAANMGSMALLESIPETASLPLPLRVACGSILAGLWRIVLMPIDTSKTVLQVDGTEGLSVLMEDVKLTGVLVLYRGSLAGAAATAVGHFPWFLTFNFLDEVLPRIENLSLEQQQYVLLFGLMRSAVLGFAASSISDCASNSLRVIKVTKQTMGKRQATDYDVGKDTNSMGEQDISYVDAVKMILKEDGWVGLFGRGLQTRLLTNALQGAAFSVLWKFFQQQQL